MTESRTVEAFRRMLLVILALSLAACTTTRVVAQGQEASLSALRKASMADGQQETFTIVTRDGTAHALLVIAVTTESVLGRTADGGKSITLAASDIDRVESRRVDTRSAFMTLGIYVLVIGAAGLYAGKALTRALPKATP
jgi:hypothetical protein